MSHLNQKQSPSKSLPRRSNSTPVLDTIHQLPPNSFILVNPKFSFSPIQNSRTTGKIQGHFASNYVSANFNFIYKNASQIDKSKIPELNDILFSHTFFSNTSPSLDLTFCAIAHQTDDYVCPICLFKPTAPRMTRCGHIFCADCLHLLFEKTEKHLCPVCYEPILKNELLRVKLILHPPSMAKCKFKKVIKYSKFNVCCLSKPKDSSQPNPNSTPNSNLITNPEIKSKSSSQIARALSQSASSNPNNSLNAAQMKAIDLFRRLPKASDPDSYFTRFSLADDNFVSEILGEEVFYIDKQIKEAAEINDLEKINALKTIRTSLVLEEQPEDTTEFQLIPEETTFPDEFVVFYQIDDGRLIFLDDLNMKMIYDNYGKDSLKDWPDEIEGNVISRNNFTIEQSSANQQIYQKYDKNSNQQNQDFLNSLQMRLHMKHLHPGAEVSVILIDMLNYLKPDIAANYKKRVQIRIRSDQMKNRESNRNKRKSREQQRVITKDDYQTFVSHNDPDQVHLTNEDFPSLQPGGSPPSAFKHLPPPTKPKEDFPSLDGNNNHKTAGVKKSWGGIAPQKTEENNVYKEEYPAFEAPKPVALKKKKAPPAWGNLKI